MPSYQDFANFRLAGLGIPCHALRRVFKLCGPGKWTISRMSCDKHDYKNVEIDHPTSAYTATDCKTYALKDYYQIHGYIGSAIFTCDATAR